MSESTATKTIYTIRDTAAGTDFTTGTFGHAGEAVAWLASHVIGLQRISFELYQIGHMYMTSGVITVKSCDRTHVMSASQAILDSYQEDVADLIDQEGN